MKKNALLILLLFFVVNGFSQSDTIPIGRQLAHDKIKEEQKILDNTDGKTDDLLKVSSNADVNIAVSDAMFRRINEIEKSVEKNKKLKTDNSKKIYLKAIENLVRNYRYAWRNKQIDPTLAPTLVDNFTAIMNATIDSIGMIDLLANVDYSVAKINADIFTNNIDYEQAKRFLYIRFCHLNPDKILQTIAPFVNESFADSLIIKSAQINPTAVYSASQAPKSVLGKLIFRNSDSLVKTIAMLSKTPNALLYFPFLDDLTTGKKTIESIKKYSGDGDIGYDSVGYFKLLVKTAIDYNKRLQIKDTPVALFGANGLLFMLHEKANKHFINQINNLHEKPELIRMKSVEPLSSIDLYYMIIMGEEEIYTSSYKHSFTRLVQRLGKPAHTDSLLENVGYDHFRKFIKMAANFNRLDTFLSLMPNQTAELVMKNFVSNLDKTDNLEDAVDVADAYSSINNKKTQSSMLQYIKENETNSAINGNKRASLIYGLLKNIILSSDSTNKIDLNVLGISNIYSIDNSTLKDDSGRIIQQVFFYGDEDGKKYFPAFVNSFNKNDWQVTFKKEWVEIKAKKGQKIWIYANRPLDNNANLDDTAQFHLNNYLAENDLQPSIVTHRGHSYWLDRTIKRMPDGAKIIVLGSCGGYKNLKQILKSSPEANIISTKQIGMGDINQPITNYLNQNFNTSKKLDWQIMWATLTKYFAKSPKEKESWEDYIPPYKNLGAIFIKAYNKKIEN